MQTFNHQPVTLMCPDVSFRVCIPVDHVLHWVCVPHLRCGVEWIMNVPSRKHISVVLELRTRKAFNSLYHGEVLSCTD